MTETDRRIGTKLMPVVVVGRYTLYAARVGTGPNCNIAVRRMRTFYVGQLIEYIVYVAAPQAVTPQWCQARVRRIDYGANRLFLDAL